MKSMDKDVEYELIRLAQDGCQESKSKLYNQWEPMIYKQSLKFARNGDVSEYISFANEGFLNAIKVFDPSKGFRFSTLLVRSVYFCLCKVYGNEKKKVEKFGFPMAVGDGGIDIVDESESPVDLLIKEQSISDLKLAISELDPPILRRIVESRMDGETLECIGIREGFTKERIRQLFISAKLKLKKSITNPRKKIKMIAASQQVGIDVILRNCIDDVISGKITPQQANSVSNLASQLIKLSVVSGIDISPIETGGVVGGRLSQDNGNVTKQTR